MFAPNGPQRGPITPVKGASASTRTPLTNPTPRVSRGERRTEMTGTRRNGSHLPVNDRCRNDCCLLRRTIVVERNRLLGLSSVWL